MSGALEGVLILDMTTMVAGPVAAMMLGDQGADVMKVESPAGDLMRRFAFGPNVVTGTGRFFCAGANLKGFYSAGSELKSRVSIFHAVISRLVRADFPVIAAVNGAAAGAGMGLACACDLLIAGESARFTMAYTKIGLSPDGTTTYFLPRRIGIGRALELVLLNRTLSAKEALDWGIANRVVDDTNLAEEAHSIAVQLAAGPTRAYGAAKRLMHSGFTESRDPD
jgi:2-(1,2-epoxy-1,2-dihydrophenyl)acetyl-CoA isomerase